jgi:hypothetical protein
MSGKSSTKMNLFFKSFSWLFFPSLSFSHTHISWLYLDEDSFFFQKMFDLKMLQQKFRQSHTLFYYLLKISFLIFTYFSLLFSFSFPLLTNKKQKKTKKQKTKSGWLQLDEPGELGPSSDALHFE